jgi:hypothetical protein
MPRAHPEDAHALFSPQNRSFSALNYKPIFGCTTPSPRLAIAGTHLALLFYPYGNNEGRKDD